MLIGNKKIVIFPGIAISQSFLLSMVYNNNNNKKKKTLFYEGNTK